MDEGECEGGMQYVEEGRVRGRDAVCGWRRGEVGEGKEESVRVVQVYIRTRVRWKRGKMEVEER